MTLLSQFESSSSLTEGIKAPVDHPRGVDAPAQSATASSSRSTNPTVPSSSSNADIDLLLSLKSVSPPNTFLSPSLSSKTDETNKENFDQYHIASSLPHINPKVSSALKSSSNRTPLADQTTRNSAPLRSFSHLPPTNIRRPSLTSQPNANNTNNNVQTTTSETSESPLSVIVHQTNHANVISSPSASLSPSATSSPTASFASSSSSVSSSSRLLRPVSSTSVSSSTSTPPNWRSQPKMIAPPLPNPSSFFSKNMASLSRSASASNASSPVSVLSNSSSSPLTRTPSSPNVLTSTATSEDSNIPSNGGNVLYLSKSECRRARITLHLKKKLLDHHIVSADVISPPRGKTIYTFSF